MKFGPFVCMSGGLAIAGIEDVESWERHGRNLFQMQKNVPWWLGDYCVFGEQRFGEDFWQCIPENMDVKMLENFTRMAKIFPPEERFPDLSWRHHSISLRIKNREVRRAMLRIAERDNLDANAFAQRVEGYGA